jgi:hypothetical protein
MRHEYAPISAALGAADIGEAERLHKVWRGREIILISRGMRAENRF